jgi:hypothetical protein
MLGTKQKVEKNAKSDGKDGRVRVSERERESKLERERENE